MLILTPVFFFLILGGSAEKRLRVRFLNIKIRISIIFMQLRSKLTAEICPKIGGLDGKTKQNRKKISTLPPFFLKKEKKNTAFVEKRKTLDDFT